MSVQATWSVNGPSADRVRSRPPSRTTELAQAQRADVVDVLDRDRDRLVVTDRRRLTVDRLPIVITRPGIGVAGLGDRALGARSADPSKVAMPPAPISASIGLSSE